jgi:hypothetical protein
MQLLTKFLAKVGKFKVASSQKLSLLAIFRVGAVVSLSSSINQSIKNHRLVSALEKHELSTRIGTARIGILLVYSFVLTASSIHPS